MIAHFDVDAFYAGVAVRDDPSLRGKPVAIAGSGRRAVVLTASYEARPFGVRSAIPLYRALQACPHLVVVPPNMQAYRSASREIFAVLARRGHPVESLSLDEAFVDFGECALGEAIELAKAMRAEIYAATQLTASAGVASGKMVAKILSDACKPNGLQGLAPGEEAAFLAPLPAGCLWGVGPKTQARLRLFGIETIGDVANLGDEGLRTAFGSWGAQVRDLARGIDRRGVRSERETKSISTEETFEYDVREVGVLVELLRVQAKEIAAKLAREGLAARSIGIKLKRADFSTLVRQTNLTEPTADPARIFRAAVVCLRRAGVRGVPVRLLGTRAAALVARGSEQLPLL